MKTFRFCAIVIVLVALCAMLLMKDSLAQTTRPAAPEPAAEVGVCDVVEVFNNYAKARDLSEEMTRRGELAKQTDDQKMTDLRNLQMTLEGLKEGSPDYQKVLEELERKTVEREVWLQTEKAGTMREHHRRTKEMYDEIISVVSAVAADRGMKVVLYMERLPILSRETQELVQAIERRKVLYGDPSVDLTEAVLARLNRKYQAGKTPMAPAGQ